MDGLTLKVHVSFIQARWRGVLMRLVVIYFVKGQEIGAVEFVILEVEGAASFEPQSKGSDVWWLDIRLLDSLSASELALGVLRGRETRSSPPAVVMIMRRCQGVVVWGLVLEMLLVVSAVEEGSHVELELCLFVVGRSMQVRRELS